MKLFCDIPIPETYILKYIIYIYIIYIFIELLRMLQEKTALDTWEYFVYSQINLINPTFKNTKNIMIKISNNHSYHLQDNDDSL